MGVDWMRSPSRRSAMKTGTPWPPRLAALLLVAVLAALGLLASRPLGASKPSAAAPARGDSGGETYYESVDVDVVSVEVVATDRSGRPVAGLTRGDFEVYEDGKPVVLTNFLSSVEDAIAAGRPVGGPDASLAPATRSADQALSFAVFVDNENLTAAARAPVLAALDGFLQSHARPGDHVLLARYDGGMKVTQPAATRAALAQAMGQLRTDTTHGGLAVEDQRRILQAKADLAEGGAPDQVIEAGELSEDAQLAGAIDVQRGKRGLAALADFISSLAGLPGRKALVIVTGAFAIDADPVLARLADHANTNRVTLYLLGAVEPPAAGAFRAPTAIGDNPFAAGDALSGALHSVADRTGGLTAANLADPSGFLERVRADIGNYYSLGFTPEHPRDGKVHRLAVRVRNRSDLSLRYRSTYEDRSGDQRVTSETLSTLLLGVGDNPLGVRLTLGQAAPPAKGLQDQVERAEAPPGAAGPRILPLVVHLPLDKLVLIPQERYLEGRVTLFVGTRDDRGRLSAVTRVDAPVRVGNDRLLDALGQSFDYRLDVRLRAGEQMVAVGVRDEIGHLDSIASAPIGESAVRAGGFTMPDSTSREAAKEAAKGGVKPPKPPTRPPAPPPSPSPNPNSSSAGRPPDGQ